MIGIDLGNDTMKIAAWSKSVNPQFADGAKIVVNDTSRRLSPVRMCFRKQSYFVCDHSNTNLVNNIPNYIWSVKRVIGSSALIEDVDKEIEVGKLKKNIEVTPERCLFNVTFDNKPIQVDVEHAMAMVLEYGYYLSAKNSDDPRNRSVIAKSLKGPDQHVIITVPSYYTASNIRGLQFALDLKDLGEAVFLQENVAVAVEFGYYRNTEGVFETPQLVVFADMGCDAATLTAVEYTTDSMKVVAVETLMMGGSDFTHCVEKLVEGLCAEQLKEASGKSVLKNEYLIGKKAKEVKETFSLDGLEEMMLEMDLHGVDDPFTADVEKATVMATYAELIQRYTAFVEAFFHSAELQGKRVDRVEISGGAMRMKVLQEVVAKAAFPDQPEKACNCTLNLEECVCRGACLVDEMVFKEKRMAVTAATVPFDYNDGKQEVHHSLRVLGCSGELVGDADARVKVVSPCAVREAATEHAWKEVAEHSREVDQTINLWLSLQEEWNRERNMVDHEFYDNCEGLSGKEARLGQLEKKEERGKPLSAEETAELQQLREERSELMQQYTEVHAKVFKIGTKPTDENIRELKTLKEELKTLGEELKKRLTPPYPVLHVTNNLHVLASELYTGKAELLDSEDNVVGFVNLRNGLKDGKMCYRWKRQTLCATYKDDKLDGRYLRFADDQLVTVKEYEDGIVVWSITFNEENLDCVAAFGGKTAQDRTGKAFFSRGVLYRFVQCKGETYSGFECTLPDGVVLYRGEFKREDMKKEKKDCYTRSGRGQFFIGRRYVDGDWNGMMVNVKGKEWQFGELREKAKNKEFDSAVWSECRVESANKSTPGASMRYFVMKTLDGKEEKSVCVDEQSRNYSPFNYCFNQAIAAPKMEYLNTSISLIPSPFRKTFFGEELVKLVKDEKDRVITLPPPIQTIVNEAKRERDEIWKAL